MKKTIAILMCAALLVVTGCSETENKKDANSGDGRYGDQSDGDMILAYTPPAGWEVVKNPSHSTLSVASRPPKAGDKYAENITLLKGSAILLKDKTLDGYVEVTMKGVRDFGEDVKILSSETVKIGDVEAREIVFTCSKHQGWKMPFKIRKWLVLSHGDVYDLTAISLQSTYADHEETFNAVGKSLRWEPAPEEEEDE